ncbi:hypothetical protein [Flavobacterium sp.]|uniref:hypothetical protein n=1 Tax=Flavobacterium sp. TaxID=239 RepID=UPI004034EE5E
MILDEVKNLNHDDDFIFAIAVGIEGAYLHSSILYKWNGRINTIDFFNQTVRNHVTIGDLGYKDYIYVKYNRDIIIDAIALQIPSLCELIKDKHGKIDFGIKYTNSKFNGDGTLVYAKGDIGLTCATFILSILNSAGIILIDLESWKERATDFEWQTEILKYYTSVNNATPEIFRSELLSHYKDNLGCFRFKPEEVAAASSAEVMPSKMDYCEFYGKDILKKLYG